MGVFLLHGSLIMDEFTASVNWGDCCSTSIDEWCGNISVGMSIGP
jgi:hypothetical protein